MPDEKWSKSGALLFRDSYGKPPLLFWGDTSITIAVGNYEATKYTNIGILISPRSDYFDCDLVESGPPPL